MRSREQTLAQRPIVCLALLLVYESPFYPESLGGRTMDGSHQ
jgi:hypothetical protein